MSHTSPETNRREFLSGKSALRVLRNLGPVDDLDAPVLPAALRDAPGMYLVDVSRDAMATEFSVLLNAGQHPESTEAALSALDLVDELEAQLTVYRSVSEIVSINQRAGREPVVVEPKLFALLLRAKELHEATAGAFDVTSGPLSRAWGFFNRAGTFPEPDAVAEALARVGSQWLEFDAEAQTIRFTRPGIEINLNAIGKGYSLDRCAELLVRRNVADFLIHGGRSSILARGSRADGEPGTHGWGVSLRHPFRSQEKLVELPLRDRALGTSGSANQFFHFQGKRFGHIIDPRTGWPADHVLSATVLAPDAATADALATAFFVMGVEETAKFCAPRPELSAVLVSHGERAGEVALHTIGLQPGEWREV